MNGFLSNTWRDILAIAGVALSLLQCLSLVRAWASKRTERKPLFRLGILKYFREAEGETKFDCETRKALWILFAVSLVVLAAGATLIRTEVPYGLLLPFMFLSAFAHEWAIFVYLMHRVSFLLSEESEWFAAPILVVVLITLLFAANYGLSLETGPRASLWHGAVLLYSSCYIVVFGLLCLVEVVEDVEWWKERQKASSRHSRKQ